MIRLNPPSIFTILIIALLILSSGCTGKTLAPNTIPVNNTSYAIIETPTPYTAPTIEKITHSRYTKVKETTIATEVTTRPTPDPIVGIWDMTNTTPRATVVFSTSGTGGIKYFSEARAFTWIRGSSEGGNVTYTIRFYDTDQDIFVYYDSSSDKGATSITGENQYLVRR